MIMSHDRRWRSSCPLVDDKRVTERKKESKVIDMTMSREMLFLFSIRIRFCFEEQMIEEGSRSEGQLSFFDSSWEQHRSSCCREATGGGKFGQTFPFQGTFPEKGSSASGVPSLLSSPVVLSSTFFPEKRVKDLQRWTLFHPVSWHAISFLFCQTKNKGMSDLLLKHSSSSGSVCSELTTAFDFLSRVRQTKKIICYAVAKLRA